MAVMLVLSLLESLLVYMSLLESELKSLPNRPVGRLVYSLLESLLESGMKESGAGESCALRGTVISPVSCCLMKYSKSVKALMLMLTSQPTGVSGSCTEVTITDTITIAIIIIGIITISPRQNAERYPYNLQDGGSRF
jgi:hypothetical protein